LAGVYLSYPFCAQKCTYCNFASGVFPREMEPRYLDTLEDQLRACQWPWTPETVYWGGGTPSLIDGDAFERVMQAVPGRPWLEATLEAAPGSITPDRAAAWARVGIDRVSLGVQSFVEIEIRRTGRKHTAAIVEQDVKTLRSAGIDRINIDLIAGLAGQTHTSWRESLTRLIDLGVGHASIYMLEVDEDSRLGRELTLGGVKYGAGDVPGEAEITSFYVEAVDRLAKAGLARYEISNFARPGEESLHNLKYWRREPYLGFGADAHSFDGRWRWGSPGSPAEYIERPAERADLIEAVEAEERLFLGLRLSEGVDAGSAPRTRSEEAGLLERSGGRLRLTEQGVLLSNEVFAEFLP
jgi:oxygen-independent coproporphyrinogen-3 oxidase